MSRPNLKQTTIRVKDAQSGALVGESEMHQGSLAAMGDKFEEIVAEASNALFDARP